MVSAIRPPVGVVVEGLTEYQCYVSLVCRCAADRVHFHVPLSNARGNDRLRTELESLLEGMVQTYHPRVVLVTLDSREALRTGAYTSCAALRSALQARCDEWLALEQRRERFSPLPLRVIVIVQHPTFESWLIADIQGLARTSGVVESVDPGIVWENVDEEVSNPLDWLAARVRRGVKLKPTGELAIARNLDVVVAEARSRSFQKLRKEVRAAYEEWARENNMLE